MGISIETLAAAKKFTSETVLGGGAVVGKNVTISSITPIDGGNRITFSYTLDNGTTKTSTLDVMNGVNGEQMVKKGNRVNQVRHLLRELIILMEKTEKMVILLLFQLPTSQAVIK